MPGAWDSGDMWDSDGGSAESAICDFDFANFNISCAARNIQDSVDLPYTSTYSTTVSVVQSIFFAFNFLVGSFLNTLVIVLVAKYKKLQTHSLLLALQVVVISLMMAVLNAISFVNVIANKWLFCEHVCALTGLLLSPQ